MLAYLGFVVFPSRICAHKRCDEPRSGVEYFMSEVKPKAEPRYAKPLLRAEPYSGPLPSRDNPKVCLSKSVISANPEKTQP